MLPIFCDIESPFDIRTRKFEEAFVIQKILHKKKKVRTELFFSFSRYPDLQKSKEIFLEVGKKYYLEGILVGECGNNHFEIGVYLPDGSNIIPITSHYLSTDANYLKIIRSSSPEAFCKNRNSKRDSDTSVFLWILQKF